MNIHKKTTSTPPVFSPLASRSQKDGAGPSTSQNTSTPPVFSPRVTRNKTGGAKSSSTASPALTRNQQKKRTWGKIFDFENDPEARRLRDEAMIEHEKYVKRQAGKNKALAEKKQNALEVRQKTLAEKNRLAEENERIRNERETEKRLRSERAVKDLVELRKRKR